MRSLNPEMKEVMRECKERAKTVGLQIKGGSLEYIVTNQDMLELRPKMMIPTLYDYWAQDVDVVRNKWMYDVYPRNPYETVINTRPVLSFYNQDNADWLNAMLFYHVLGHIDFFQNNLYFRNTWYDDFCGQALADKRLINKIREKLGVEKRWVDYVIEFSLSIDNLVGYYRELEEIDKKELPELFGQVSKKANFYFGEFLRQRYQEGVIDMKFYYDEVERYNRQGEAAFFEDNFFRAKFPEFHEVLKQNREKKKKTKPKDLLQYLMENSEFLNKEKNKWMKSVIDVIRRTSLHFQPQIRTHGCNEGWASLWHERLFITDRRIDKHRVDWAYINSLVLRDIRIGFNPYALYKHLYEFIEEMARCGKLSRRYQLIRDIEARKRFNENRGEDYAKEVLFEARRRFDDYQLINFLTDDDFQDFMDRYKLFLVGTRLPDDLEKLLRGVAEVYIKSKKAKDYRQFLNKILYHPPHILIEEEKAPKPGELYLNHVYEGRSLVTKYVPSVLIGLEFLNGKPVHFETTEYEYEAEEEKDMRAAFFRRIKPKHKRVRVLYTCKNREVERKVLEQSSN
jgi:stage V sporulation protein R